MFRELQKELHEINSFVKLFAVAGNHAKNKSNISNMKLIIHNIHGKNKRQYNQPTASEIAIIILDSNYKSNIRDIVIKTYEGQLKYISELYDAYDPLQYPLLFFYGKYR
jgi:hypothetical protein